MKSLCNVYVAYTFASSSGTFRLCSEGVLLARTGCAALPEARQEAQVSSNELHEMRSAMSLKPRSKRLSANEVSMYVSI